MTVTTEPTTLATTNVAPSSSCMWPGKHLPCRLALWRPLLPHWYSYKATVPDSFVIFDIRALWRSGLSVRVPRCQNYKWRLNPLCHRIAVPIWQRWASKGLRLFRRACGNFNLSQSILLYCCTRIFRKTKFHYYAGLSIGRIRCRHSFRLSVRVSRFLEAGNQ